MRFARVHDAHRVCRLGRDDDHGVAPTLDHDEQADHHDHQANDHDHDARHHHDDEGSGNDHEPVADEYLGAVGPVDEWSSVLDHEHHDAPARRQPTEP